MDTGNNRFTRRKDGTMLESNLSKEEGLIMPLHAVTENASKAGEAMVPGISVGTWATANSAKLTDFPTKAALRAANASKAHPIAKWKRASNQ